MKRWSENSIEEWPDDSMESWPENAILVADRNRRETGGMLEVPVSRARLDAFLRECCGGVPASEARVFDDGEGRALGDLRIRIDGSESVEDVNLLATMLGDSRFDSVLDVMWAVMDGLSIGDSMREIIGVLAFLSRPGAVRWHRLPEPDEPTDADGRPPTFCERLGRVLIDMEYGGIELAPVRVLRRHFDCAAYGRDLISDEGLEISGDGRALLEGFDDCDIELYAPDDLTREGGSSLAPSATEIDRAMDRLRSGWSRIADIEDAGETEPAVVVAVADILDELSEDDRKAVERYVAERPRDDIDLVGLGNIALQADAGVISVTPLGASDGEDGAEAFGRHVIAELGGPQALDESVLDAYFDYHAYGRDRANADVVTMDDIFMYRSSMPPRDALAIGDDDLRALRDEIVK